MAIDPISTRAREVIAYIKETGTTGLSLLLVSFYLGQAAGLVPDVSRNDHKEISSILVQMKEFQTGNTDAQRRILEENRQLMMKQTELTRENSENTKRIARNLCFIVPNLSKSEKSKCLNGVQ